MVVKGYDDDNEDEDEDERPDGYNTLPVQDSWHDNEIKKIDFERHVEVSHSACTYINVRNRREIEKCTIR